MMSKADKARVARQIDAGWLVLTWQYRKWQLSFQVGSKELDEPLWLHRIVQGRLKRRWDTFWVSLGTKGALRAFKEVEGLLGPERTEEVMRVSEALGRGDVVELRDVGWWLFKRNWRRMSGVPEKERPWIGVELWTEEGRLARKEKIEAWKREKYG